MATETMDVAPCRLVRIQFDVAIDYYVAPETGQFVLTPLSESSESYFAERFGLPVVDQSTRYLLNETELILFMIDARLHGLKLQWRLQVNRDEF